MKRAFSWTMAIFIFSIIPTIAQDYSGINPEHLPPGKFDFSTPVINTIELSPNLRLEYAEQGNPDGIPVILLHGFTDSRHSFDMILPYLPASLHVYALSLRGHGNSSKPQQGYQPEDFSKDIADFIQRLEIRKPILVGHSMGSTIIQNFIIKYPSLSRGIILAASFADYNKPELMDFKKTIDQLTDPIDTLFAAAFQNSTVMRPVPESMMKLFIAETGKVPAYVWKGIAAGWSNSNYAIQLMNYNNPALIIWGDKDNYSSQKDQAILLQSLKRSTLSVYKGTGHAIHWEEPGRFAKEVMEFANSLK